MHTISSEELTLDSQIASLIIPVANKTLILPTVSVAEVLPYTKPQLRSAEIDQIPGWFLGKLSWRGTMVPVISYEAINGEQMPGIKDNTQMGILNSTGVSSRLPFICFPIQGIPHLINVVPDMIKEDSQQKCGLYDEMSIIINSQPATIPNLTRLEQATVQLLNLE